MAKVTKIINMPAKNRKRCSWFLFMLGLLLLTACQPQKQTKNQFVFTGPIMGTEYRITVVALLDADAKAIDTVIVDAMQRVNRSMSNYLPDSELSKFNRLAGGQAQTISADFAAVMREAMEVSELSEGAFDVTLGKAIDAWGFGPDGTITRQPGTAQLESLRNAVGYKKMQLKDNVLSKSADGLEVSLSAIAKGYAVDQVAESLRLNGMTDFLINIGGELRASGQTVDQQPWRVGIEKPHILGGIQQIVSLDDKAIATSGDYRNYLVIDGKRFSHTIDSKTLSPVFYKLALVSVISERASTADAFATAMMAMGEERAWEFAQKHDLAAYLVVRVGDEDKYSIKVTEKFSVNLQ